MITDNRYGLTAEQIEDWEERAGILQYDAGMTREQAEEKAATMVKGKWPWPIDEE